MKRFGRNQRRHLRDIIAGLERKLYGEYEAAAGNHPALEGLVKVLESEITDEKSPREIRKEARLTVYVTADRALQGLWQDRNYPLVEYDGLVWRLREMQMEDYRNSFGSSSRYETIGGPPVIELKLIAEPHRGPRR